MKNLTPLLFPALVLFSALLFTQKLNAQGPTLTQAIHQPQIGASRVLHYADTVGVQPGPGGPGQVWDFSFLQPNGVTDTVSFISPPAINPGLAFPNANIAEHHSNFPLPGASGEFYQFYTNFADSTHYLGWEIPNAADAGPWVYSALPLKNMRFPFAYNDTYRDTVSGEFFGIFLLTWNGRAEVTADGWGTLILPNATFNNVLRVKTEQWLVILGNNPLHFVQYDWYGAQDSFPLFSLNEDYLGLRLATPLPLIVYRETGQKKHATIQLFPNPANGIVQYSVDGIFGEKRRIELIDVQGKTVRELEESLAGNSTQKTGQFDIGGLQPGIYLLRISTKYQSATQKLIIKP